VIAPSLDTAQRMERYSPGLPIVAAAHPEPAESAPERSAPPLGAMPERVSGLSWAWIIPAGWDAERTIAFFLELRERNLLLHAAPQPPRGPSPVPHDSYETEYLRPAK
jgi:hypothetical protein